MAGHSGSVQGMYGGGNSGNEDESARGMRLDKCAVVDA